MGAICEVRRERRTGIYRLRQDGDRIRILSVIHKKESGLKIKYTWCDPSPLLMY
jgi:hypothetical protein